MFRIIVKRDPSGRIYHSSLESLYEDVERLVGDRLRNNGIPVAIEAEGWAELAAYDEVWEDDDIVIICTDD